ncbi:MAG: Ig domain-containing protein [Steroidobacteraceae bacterium]
MTRRLQSAGIALAASLLIAIAAGCGGGGGGNDPPPPPPLNISSSVLADGVIGIAYNQTIAATGGTGARTFSISAGALPAGLTLNATNGVVSGTPAGPIGAFDFTANVADSGTPQQDDAQTLTITINATAQGRNNSIATATPLGNGTFAASISPGGHPNTVFAPDEDFYAITTTASSMVTVDIDANFHGSPLDPVIAIVGANGDPLTTCGPAFDEDCVQDDEEPGILLDPLLTAQVTGATTFYVHVVDFRGDARPDMLYDIVISGVN